MNDLNIKKKIIILIFDALPYAKVVEFGHISLPHIEKSKIIKLESLIGYSCGLYPSIWTGLYPNKLNLWSDFKFKSIKEEFKIKTKNSSVFNKLIDLFPYLPKILTQIISIFLTKLSSIFKLIQYPYPVNYDFKLNKHFYYDHTPYDFIFHPQNLFNQNLSTVFSKLSINGISFKYIYTKKLIHNFSTFNENIIVYSNPILDSMGHKYGPNSNIYKRKIIKIFKWINSLVSENDYNFILFSDHGMTPVIKRFYPKVIFKDLKLQFYKDILVWFDSTMLKIWLISKKSLRLKKELLNKFNDSKSGHFLTEFEKKKYGLNFTNRKFGDLIFLVNPYLEIFPNFFGINPFRPSPGLHGYHPTHKSSYGIFYSNFLEYQEPMNIVDIYHLLIQKLNLN